MQVRLSEQECDFKNVREAVEPAGPYIAPIITNANMAVITKLHETRDNGLRNIRPTPNLL